MAFSSPFPWGGGPEACFSQSAALWPVAAQLVQQGQVAGGGEAQGAVIVCTLAYLHPFWAARSSSSASATSSSSSSSSYASTFFAAGGQASNSYPYAQARQAHALAQAQHFASAAACEQLLMAPGTAAVAARRAHLKARIARRLRPVGWLFLTPPLRPCFFFGAKQSGL